MAKGDIINGSAALATTASGTFQPAAGVEIILTTFGTESGLADLDVSIYDGTGGAIPVVKAVPLSAQKYFVPVNNTRYLSLKNNNAGTKYYIYAGVQTK